MDLFHFTLVSTRPPSATSPVIFRVIDAWGHSEFRAVNGAVIRRRIDLVSTHLTGSELEDTITGFYDSLAFGIALDIIYERNLLVRFEETLAASVPPRPIEGLRAAAARPPALPVPVAPQQGRGGRSHIIFHGPNRQGYALVFRGRTRRPARRGSGRLGPRIITKRNSGS